MAAPFDLNDDSVVVIIGTGAGGGVLGNELAQKGIKVVALVAISLVFAVATGLLASIVTAVKLSAPETYLTLREGE